MRCIRAEAVATGLLLAALLLPAATAAATGPAVESSFNITALPESCSFLRKDFGGKYFEYTIGWSSSSSFADCNVEVSRLYIDGACSTYRNNLQSQGWGCNGNPHGSVVHGSNASCEAALRNGQPDWWTAVRANAPGQIGDKAWYDGFAMCATSPIGYFYIHNSCNQTVSFTLTIRTQALDASPCPVPEPVPTPAPVQRSQPGVDLLNFTPAGYLIVIFIVGVVWGMGSTFGSRFAIAFCRARQRAAAGARRHA
ncbi:hypothetical protein COHA_001300 [Chlorella ohadii]|uniref:Uncharacterized protein n=1 Tax=Chlorella ohadii TaxID=2649997 RepID=A0AAD5DYZ1_9CHLO|nr:hypothetical protein COHA_001300 [Chlorella ohadii]